MTRSIDAIIAELLTLDPALKEHEAALKPLVKALLAADPAREPDETFLAELRSRLQQRAAILSSPSSSPSFSMSKFFYALTGAVAAVVIAVPAATYVAKHGTAMPSGSKESLFEYEVTPAEPEAFGSLSTTELAGMGGGPRPQSGGGGGGVAANPAPAATSAIAPEGYAMDEKMMVYPPGEITMYQYVYEGELPALPGDTVDVLKRQTRFPNVPLSLIANRFDIGAIDLDTFGSAKLEYANFIEDEEFGYVINLGLRDGSISINQNWMRWPQSKCQDDACWKAEQVKIDQLPADSEIIRIAQAFVDDHGIDVSRYGEPFVDNTWKADYERATDKSMAYVPEIQRVIFPLKVEGKEVFEQYGDKAGISVGVSVKYKRVSDMWGAMDQTYKSSAYDAVKDAKTINDYLSTFERWDPVGMGDVKVKNIRVTLGTPTYALSRFYNYQDAQTVELLVPSLVFPVVSAEGNDPVYRKAVVVPLAKELLQQNQGGRPMPLMEKGE